MKKERIPAVKYIPDQNVPARESKSLIWYLIFICFGYHYKVIACGLFGKTLGYDWICNTLVHGVTTNHWFEVLIYVPLLWYAFYRVIQIVFGPNDGEALSGKVRQLKTIAFFLLFMYIYAYGIHFTNTIEIYSRKYLGIDSGPLYDQIWWADEQLSHWMQFVFLFPLFAWLIINDRLDRTQNSYMAVFIGLLQGLERAVGTIEGNSPILALVLSPLVIIACAIRWKKHSRSLNRAWKDFFFRYGISFGLGMPIAIFSYHFIFGSFVQPSSMGDNAWKVVFFASVYVVLGFFLAYLSDRLTINKKLS